MKPVQFVNVFGESVDPATIAKKHRKARPPAEAKSYHKGFRVIGFEPGRIEAAEVEHLKKRAQKLAEDKPVDIGDWNADAWRTKAKKTPVRAKPYEMLAAASECKALAIKAGWLDVDVVAICKEAN